MDNGLTRIHSPSRQKKFRVKDAPSPSPYLTCCRRLLVRWFYEGSEPFSACNRERIQLVDIQYAPKALS